MRNSVLHTNLKKGGPPLFSTKMAVAVVPFKGDIKLPHLKFFLENDLPSRFTDL
jgi:hypothetical protein